jgi:hypothetical protein
VACGWRLNTWGGGCDTQGRVTVLVLQRREPPTSSAEDDTPVPTRDIISRVSGENVRRRSADEGLGLALRSGLPQPPSLLSPSSLPSYGAASMGMPSAYGRWPFGGSYELSVVALRPLRSGRRRRRRRQRARALSHPPPLPQTHRRWARRTTLSCS